jgi:hypothetical protein
MSNRNADKNGKATRFSATNQPKRNGRKSSLYTQLKEMAKLEGNIDLSREDFSKMTMLMLSKPLSELQTLAKSEDTPIWIVNIVRAIIKDASDGRISTLDSLLDRLFGKATQPMVQDVSVEMQGSIPVSEWVRDRLKKK